MVGSCLQIAAHVHVEIEVGVASEQVEHVIEKADAGLALALSGAVEVQRELHLGLAGVALDRGGPVAHGRR